jgi:hypothetical protein
MNNPYQILNVSQDAGKDEIIEAQAVAMKEKKYSLNEIHSAVRQLLDPAKRLAADFMHPAKIIAKRPQKILTENSVPDINVDEIDDDSFDSLKNIG